VRFDNPDRKNAYARQYSLGYERQVGSNMGLSVDFIRSEQRNQYVAMELNPLVRETPALTSTPRRINPLVGSVGDWAASVITLVNDGWANYNSIQVSGTKRYGDNWQARISYAFSRGRATSGTLQADTADSQFLGDLNLDAEVGPTNVDRPHILTLTGTWDVPRTGGLKLSGVYSARSGTPFSLRDTSSDHDRNGLTANEYLPAGNYQGVGDLVYDVDYKGGRNGARGPSYQRFDFRAGYRFRLAGGRTFDAFLDVFNLTDKANFANPAGDRRVSSSFLVLTETNDESTPRTAQLNLRFGF
jgi:hypothetical protein